jgi:hypothetical protein
MTDKSDQSLFKAYNRTTQEYELPIQEMNQTRTQEHWSTKINSTEDLEF